MTDARPQDLARFIAVLGDALTTRLDASGSAGAVTRRIFAALESAGQAAPRTPPVRLEACAYLDTAVVGANAGPAAVVAGAFAALTPRLSWRHRPGSNDADFLAGHANTLIAGPGGLESRQDVMVGASLLAPEVRYPDHQHPPEEVYYVLSPGEWRQADGPWHTPGIGGTVHNPPGVRHAMRSGPAPLLAVWCLWLSHPSD